MKNALKSDDFKAFIKSIAKVLEKDRVRYVDLLFFHPDYTVGTGIAPVPAFRLADFTADREFHPALKIKIGLIL